jgi:hypothetical protein
MHGSGTLTPRQTSTTKSLTRTVQRLRCLDIVIVDRRLEMTDSTLKLAFDCARRFVEWLDEKIVDKKLPTVEVV